MSSIKGLPQSETSFDGSTLRVAIVHARWNKSVIDALVAGAVAKLKEHGVKDRNILIQSVPGSFELPIACQRRYRDRSSWRNVLDLPDHILILAFRTPAPTTAAMPNQPVDAVIAIGVLIKGSTMHFEYICDSVSHALMRVQLDTGVPVIFGVLTALTDDQALERAGLGRGENKGHNHGEDWGSAAVEMASHTRRWSEAAYEQSQPCTRYSDEEEVFRTKVLLMGASGSGKTSMRSLIFSNNPASLTSRLGATIDVEQNHVRFLGDLILNLWDCGGQDSFMDSYLSHQRSTIFQHVGVMIYVFEVESRDMAKDLVYYKDCLDALKKYSPEANVFLLVHKMDLVTGNKTAALEKKERDLQYESGDMDVTVFGTSIYDESLYKAWSRIVHTLIPNAAVLTRHLTTFAEACSATEVILFERTTFLVIATSTQTPQSADVHQLSTTRYERTSELIKALKHSASRVREEFHALEMELPEYTAVLDEMTKNTYVLIIVHDPVIETAALKINIRLARRKFEELQGNSIIS
ncbi:hypothetical protein EW146_g3627 [Bondarzewia mesenterica]|uniref:6,7-dimethyl-8-ribityllumazine synthase n=1 Tax=Bondarzewia mesenterica TaxID=1095465 RepID=A0A4S4M2V3_9AGAM|nr:hypothetical protein EW146_g3627 [Bondarzewia mesenterica]